MTKITFTTAALMAAALFTSCSSQKSASKQQETFSGQVSPHPYDPQFDSAFGVDPEDTPILHLSKGSNEMAFQLFSQMQGFDSKVMSPISITYLMGMLANGAQGQTRTDIIKALQCSGLTAEQINNACRVLMEQAAADTTDVLNVANYVAVSRTFNLRPAFVGTLRSSYDAEVEALDFNDKATADHINSWCSKHTDGMIPKFLEEVDPTAMSYILNAIYFNGTWAQTFSKSETRKEAFRGYTRDRKMADMMHQESKFDYYSNGTYSAVTLPYSSYSYGMTILLPAEGKSISDMMKQLTAEEVTKKLPSQMERCMVDLKLPRFTTSTETQLNDLISKLGASSMFSSSKADFSLLADGSFHVAKMLQKAKIEVSEEGTRAAAITGAMVGCTSLQPEPRRVSFHANRPFVYLITDQRTGAILFMGQFTGDEL